VWVSVATLLSLDPVLLLFEAVPTAVELWMPCEGTACYLLQDKGLPNLPWPEEE